MQNKKIAVTGGIGSGKSVFCEILGEKGYSVFSCDEISKNLRRDGEYLALVKSAFPDCVINDELNECALSEKVFSDEIARSTLNAISHPLIMKRLFAQMAVHSVSFAEVPLLFEGGYENLFDLVVVLVREKGQRVASVMARSGLTEAQTLARMGAQFDYDKLSGKNCIVIENNGTVADLEKKAEDFLSCYGL